MREDNIDIRNKIQISFDNGYESLYYLCVRPRDLLNRDMVKYSGYMGFNSLEDYNKFCLTFKSEEDLLEYFFRMNNQTGSDMYKLLEGKLNLYFTVKGYNLYEPQKPMRIKYGSKLRVKVKDEIH
jgi:hypothetical protein